MTALLKQKICSVSTIFVSTSALSDLASSDALRLLHTLLVPSHVNLLSTVISTDTVLNVSTNSACLEGAPFCLDATTHVQQIRIALNSNTVTSVSKVCAMI